MKIVLAGSIGRLPIGGYSWMDMQWLAGLSDLGHDVYYVEDCGSVGSWVYNWDTEELTNDLEYPATYVGCCLDAIGLGDHWIYRSAGDSAGMSLPAFLEVCSEADLLIVHGVPMVEWRPEYLRPERRIFVDVDPGFIQIKLVNGDPALTETADRCHRLFTIGQRIGLEGCRIPTAGREWVRTRPPVALPLWPLAPPPGPDAPFTCVMQWRGFQEVVHEGVRYGQKDVEFPRFIGIPAATGQRFLLAVTGNPPDHLERHGWEVLPGWDVSRTPWTYQDFIRSSRAEFGVAKHGYVAMQGGWFSDRSLCYLATGRPVLVEDTGLRDWLPVGTGVVTFDDPRSACEGIEAINSEYEAHAGAARAIAEEHFAADRVLPAVLERAMA